MKDLDISKVYIVLIILAFLSLFPNINFYEFRVEESLRTIVAFEMAHNGNIFQPTFLGELYFKKPPLFNWFIIFSSKIIPWSELTARIVSIFFLFLTVLLLYRFSFKLTQSREISIFSSLIYITFIDILFWYGYLAEIDVTLTFFVFLTFYFLIFGFKEKKDYYFLLAGITTGFAFLLKGFPAYVFFVLTYLGLVFYYKDFKKLLNLYVWIGGFFSLLIPAVWIINTVYPDKYVQILFFESIVRTEGSKNFLKFIEHIISYPVLNFKQLLPASAFVVFGLFFFKKKINIPSDVKLLVFIAIINYLPYLISVGSRGRYVLPLFPILATVFSILIYSFGSKKILRIFVYISVVLITVRFLFGFVGFPILMEKKASRKKVAYDIAKTLNIKEKKIAFDCSPEKSVCLYLDFIKGVPIKKSKFTNNWDYLLTCKEKKDFKLIKMYDLHGNILRVYSRD